MDVINLNENRMVCPFRTETKLVPNEFNAANQVVLYPECQYILCPYYNKDALEIKDKCSRISIERIR